LGLEFVKVVNHGKKRGIGPAYISAMNIAMDAGYEKIATMDADGSHSPLSIPKLWKASLEHSADVVIASRYVKGGSTANSWVEIQMSRMLNAIYSIVLGIGAKDISTNFKIYKTELLENLDLRCSNYDIVEELLLKIKRKKRNLVIVEIPDHFEQRLFGQSKRKLSVFIASYVITLFRLRFTRQSK
jgi:dolichol-phosphate mannosyltransferase